MSILWYVFRYNIISLNCIIRCFGCISIRIIYLSFIIFNLSFCSNFFNRLFVLFCILNSFVYTLFALLIEKIYCVLGYIFSIILNFINSIINRACLQLFQIMIQALIFLFLFYILNCFNNSFIAPTKSTVERYRYPYTFLWMNLRMYHYPMILISYSA